MRGIHLLVLVALVLCILTLIVLTQWPPSVQLRVPLLPAAPRFSIVSMPHGNASADAGDDMNRHRYVRQLLAVQSWRAAFGPDIPILLGTVGVAAEVAPLMAAVTNVHALERIATDARWGLPYHGALMERGFAATTGEYLLYINTDEILWPQGDTRFWFERVAACQHTHGYRHLFLTLQRHEVLLGEGAALPSILSYLTPRLPQLVAASPMCGGSCGDFYLVSRSLFDGVTTPPYMMGRSAWDNWMIGHAVRQHGTTLGIEFTSPLLRLVHLNHTRWRSAAAEAVFNEQVEVNRQHGKDVYQDGIMDRLAFHVDIQEEQEACRYRLRRRAGGETLCCL